MQDEMQWEPTFIGIGAEKSATTWCWACLNEHPDICMSSPKELNFFNQNYGRGISWYKKHFHKPSATAIGEISPLYMDSPEVPDRILSSFPSIQILVVLRNPFERALSHLLMDLKKNYGDISKLNPSDTARLVENADKYIRRSLYYKALAPYFLKFRREKIFIFFYDDIKNNPRKFIKDLYKALGVQTEHIPESLYKQLNKSRSFKSKQIFRFLQSISQFMKKTKGLSLLRESLHRNTSLREWLLEKLQVDKGQPKFNFIDVFGLESQKLLLEDLTNLKAQLDVSIPPIWINSIENKN